MKPQKILPDNFDDIINASQGIVAVEFFATWCGHCRQFQPIIEDMCEELSEHATFYQFDVDDDRDFAKKIGIENIPTIIWFKDGEKVSTSIGNLKKSEIREKVEDLKSNNK